MMACEANNGDFQPKNLAKTENVISERIRKAKVKRE